MLDAAAGGTSASDARVTAPNDASATTDAGGGAPDSAADAGPGPAGAALWPIDNLKSIGGHPTMVLGNPMVIDTPAGKAVQFDGKGDALLVDDHPLAGLGQFTVEILFRPDADGAFEQRFFDMAENGSDHRVLFEIRLMNGMWFLDVVIDSEADRALIYASKALHPAGAWYNVAAVLDGKRARIYVNGVEQTAVDLAFRPLKAGRTFIGVRSTRISYFKGAMRLARFTPAALTPGALLAPDR
jgi:hypothetical protein